MELVYILHTLLLLPTFVYSFGPDLIGGVLGKTVVRMEKFEQCPGVTNIPANFTDVVISMVGIDRVELSGKANLRETVVAPAPFSAKLYKCASKQESSSCEYYYTYKHEDFCKLIGAKEMPWTELIEKQDLPKSCPIKPDVYDIKNAYLDFTKMASVPYLTGYWKAEATGSNKGKQLFCLNFEFSLNPATKRRNRN